MSDNERERLNCQLLEAEWASDERETLPSVPFEAPASPAFGWERGWFVLLPALGADQ